MQIIRYPSKEDWAGITERPAIENGMLRKQVGKIIADVKKNGDRSLKRYAKKFDGVDLKQIAVGQHEIIAAENNVSASLKAAINVAIENIKRFHAQQVEGIKKNRNYGRGTVLAKAHPHEKGRPLYSWWFSTIVFYGLDAWHSCTNRRMQ